jgi:hypothetical protein
VIAGDRGVAEPLPALSANFYNVNQDLGCSCARLGPDQHHAHRQREEDHSLRAPRAAVLKTQFATLRGVLVDTPPSPSLPVDKELWEAVKVKARGRSAGEFGKEMAGQIAPVTFDTTTAADAAITRNAVVSG